MQALSQSKPESRKPTAIAVLVTGYALLFAMLGWVTVRLDELCAAAGLNFIDPAITLVLAAVKVLGNLAFSRNVVFNPACGIFVLLCALIGIVFGLRLLSRKTTVASTR
jgi:hypothetical protein